MSEKQLEEGKDVIRCMLEFIESVSVLGKNDRKLAEYVIEQAELSMHLNEQLQGEKQAHLKTGKRVYKLEQQNKRYGEFFEAITELQLYINYTEKELYQEVLRITDEFLLEGES